MAINQFLENLGERARQYPKGTFMAKTTADATKSLVVSVSISQILSGNYRFAGPITLRNSLIAHPAFHYNASGQQ